MFVLVRMQFHNHVDQLCPTQVAYWAKNHVASLTRAAHLMTY